ncbi:uncharacterized protein LOC143850920 [Tasmannia lanceolata]|uniref:uncharacterized protein LOC143850920 n=1 Tax=Tasmannia lanceolata TaxID=3420 RepID=UPI0040644072
MDEGERRRSSDSSSPEFEFWMVRNPSFPQPQLLSADELFVDGVLLPLHLLPKNSDPDKTQPESEPEPDSDPETINAHGLMNSIASFGPTAPPTEHSDPEKTQPGSEPEPEPDPEPSVLSASKRWKDIFKMSEKKPKPKLVSRASQEAAEEKDREKKKKKEKKSGFGSAADVSINIWPFSRSHSAGNGLSRPKSAAARKVSSAPCSRSNSGGESKTKKWPSSPGRAGVHLGRTSPVWQVRPGRGPGSKPGSEPVVRSSDNKNGDKSSSSRVRVLNLNVPLCIGYRQHLSCTGDGNGVPAMGVHEECSNVNKNGNTKPPFSMRTLFSKKVY